MIKIYRNRRKLKEATEQFCKPQNITTEYNRGLANGLQCALAIMENRSLGDLILYGAIK